MTTPQLVEVKVEQGILRGQTVVTEDGLSFDAFRGIPYAQPPVGPLRFKAPRPVEPWEGVRSALEEGPQPPQIPYYSPTEIIGDEDCLYLNVYTPQVPSSVAAKRPIMVWIHPGGFSIGSGSAIEYGPELLVAKDVVIVTINYRLGALGFLSLGSPAAPGNYGLKDTVLALRWVKANGAVFGGDTDNITIFGCSAGSAAVQMLQVSPSAKGLFHKAIAQSFSSISHLLLWDNPRDRAVRLAKVLGATDDDVKDDESILEFLRTQSPNDLVLGSHKIVITPEELEVGATFMFTPVSEENIVPNDPQEEVFLPGRPLELLKKGPLVDVPLIIGVCDLEGIIVDVLFPPEAGLAAIPEVLAKYDKDLEKGLPKELRDGLSPEKKKEAVNQLRKIFFDGGAVNKVGYYTLQSDLVFNNSILEEARIHARQKSNPVYVYSFAVRGKINRISVALLRKKPEEFDGTCHADELSYLWNTNPPYPPIPKPEPNSLESRTQERIVTLWTNFAKTGNPTPDGQLVEGIRWPELPKDVGSSIPYLNFAEELTVPPTGAFQERVEFWDSLYSQLE